MGNYTSHKYLKKSRLKDSQSYKIFVPVFQSRYLLLILTTPPYSPSFPSFVRPYYRRGEEDQSHFVAGDSGIGIKIGTGSR